MFKALLKLRAPVNPKSYQPPRTLDPKLRFRIEGLRFRLLKTLPLILILSATCASGPCQDPDPKAPHAQSPIAPRSKPTVDVTRGMAQKDRGGNPESILQVIQPL